MTEAIVAGALVIFFSLWALVLTLHWVDHQERKRGIRLQRIYWERLAEDDRKRLSKPSDPPA